MPPIPPHLAAAASAWTSATRVGAELARLSEAASDVSRAASMAPPAELPRHVSHLAELMAEGYALQATHRALIEATTARPGAWARFVAGLRAAVRAWVG